MTLAPHMMPASRATYQPHPKAAIRMIALSLFISAIRQTGTSNADRIPLYLSMKN
jgi:hypothetical protein